MKLDIFDHLQGWSTSTEIIPETEEDDFEKQLQELGFNTYELLGDEFCRWTIKQRDDAFLIEIDTMHGRCEFVYCPNLPSLLSALKQLAPWYRMQRSTRTAEMAEQVYELLVDFGEGGPLDQCLHNKRRHHREMRAAGEKLKAAKEAKATQ